MKQNNCDINLGTIIIGALCSESVIIGCDTRLSVANYVCKRVGDKIVQITSKTYCCFSGDAGKAQQMVNYVIGQADLYETQYGCTMPVRSVAFLLHELCYRYKNTANFITAGWDAHQGYQVYAIPSNGMILEQPILMDGSGAYAVRGYVQQQYRRDMTIDEGVAFVTDAVKLAIRNDAQCGGVVRIVVITENDVKCSTYLNSDDADGNVSCHLKGISAEQRLLEMAAIPQDSKREAESEAQPSAKKSKT